MASFNKFEQFARDFADGVHDFDLHTVNVYLSNATPSAAGDAIKTDLAEIATGNGYTGPVDTQNDVTSTGGTASVTGVDVTITASGGSVGPFRYVVLYNDTPTSPVDPLIGWWDYGSSVTLSDGESFQIDFGTSMFTVA